MTALPYALDPPPDSSLGLIVLQADMRIELDFRRLLPPDLPLHVSRVPSAPDISAETLRAIGAHLGAAASLFPVAYPPAVVGYGCTSGTAQLGQAGIAERIRAGSNPLHVTEPVTALIAACRALGLRRLAFLSPYVQPVSERLRVVLAQAGIETPVFGSFDEAIEDRVARIASASTLEAARTLVGGAQAPVDGLFLSCTNLHTLDVVTPLEGALGIPVLSSNLVLAWHMLGLTGSGAGADVPGRLFRQAPPGPA